MIQIKHLDFFYHQQQVLFDIELTLEENTITGLIGPNGAGKSTLMRCIAGLEIPSHGEVLLNDVPILENPQKSYTQIGYLPDIFGLSEHLTILQHWTYSAYAKGVKQQEIYHAIEEIAEFLNLEHKLNDKISSLSRGQRQRVGIGQSIIHQPKLLILDEPASGLDPEARYELSILFNRLKDKGMTLLVSSHILSELDEYCTHMLVIKDGRIVKHQALNNENSDFIYAEQTYIPLMLRFATLNTEHEAILKQAPYITHIQCDLSKSTVIASILPNPQYRVELIQYLIQHQIPLIGVEILKESLLNSYQKSLRGE